MRWWLLAGAALLALWLRTAHLGYGLPQTFNADEPHIVNLAVSFGSGSLKPYSFKYPTLWPTVLFGFYGLTFALWSGFGLLRSVADFAALFAWKPTAFYLIGRGLAAFFGAAALLQVWRMERELRPDEDDRDLPWAALLLAFSPVMVEASHAAKPDMLMFFLAASAWLFAVRIYQDGARASYWACGASLGLAMSAQYTALAAATLLPLAHLLRWRMGLSDEARETVRWRFLAEGVAAAAAGFFVGSPYILLDFPRFWAAMRDFSALAGVREKPLAEIAAIVHLNLWNFAGRGSIAGVAALVGLVRLWRRDRGLALLMALPLAAYTLSLSAHPDGGWVRYLLGAFPGTALLAGEGLSAACGRASSWRGRAGQAVTALVMALALGPGIYAGWLHNRDLGLPDTRTISAGWINANIPAGAVLLLDSPHAGPMLVMAREQAAELARATKAAGSPRWRLYGAMASSHPGGGYRIFRIKRSAADLRSNPELVRMSQAETAALDVGSGLAPARAAGVAYVVTSSHGATPLRSPELRVFFEELLRSGRLVKEFAPVRGRVRGPHLRVYRI